MIEDQMPAVRLHTLGDPASLRYERISTPQPAPQEVLVRVQAAAITHDELEWPEGRLPATPSWCGAIWSGGSSGTAEGDGPSPRSWQRR